jgi:hypothetical protein
MVVVVIGSTVLRTNSYSKRIVAGRHCRGFSRVSLQLE